MSVSRSETVRRGYGGALTRSEPGHLNDGTPAYVHVASVDDFSDATCTYGTTRNRDYDSRCGWCYLGAPHSVAAHDQKIDQHRRTDPS